MRRGGIPFDQLQKTDHYQKKKQRKAIVGQGPGGIDIEEGNLHSEGSGAHIDGRGSGLDGR